MNWYPWGDEAITRAKAEDKPIFLSIGYAACHWCHVMEREVSLGPKPDNNVEWDGLRHDSRDTLYRTPGGAVPAGTPVILRFRTYHNDVASVKVRVYDLNAASQQILPMTLAASDVSCYQDLPFTCDYWATTLNSSSPNNLWYRFIIADGTDTDYYADNTPALDGGLGATTDDAVDNSYALMFYDLAFAAPSWAKNAVIYQIFPDRFFNGDPGNDPNGLEPRYNYPNGTDPDVPRPPLPVSWASPATSCTSGRNSSRPRARTASSRAMAGAPGEAELAGLKRENERLREENILLKKAAVYFAKASS